VSGDGEKSTSHDRLKTETVTCLTDGAGKKKTWSLGWEGRGGNRTDHHHENETEGYKKVWGRFKPTETEPTFKTRREKRKKNKFAVPFPNPLVLTGSRGGREKGGKVVYPVRIRQLESKKHRFNAALEQNWASLIVSVSEM